jgi:hypothetical protein
VGQGEKVGPTQLRGAALLCAAVAATAALALLGSSAGKLASANAASCSIPTWGLSGNNDNLTIEGGTCSELTETLDVYCSAGKIFIDHTVEGGPVDTNNTGIDCAAPHRISIFGNGGDDELDLSRVSLLTGFSGIAGQSRLDGGLGGDQLLGTSFSDAALGGEGADTAFLRDGRADSADCGPDVDSAIADQPSLDPLLNCENVDALAEPPPPLSTAPTLVPVAVENPQCAALRAKLKNAKTKKKRRKIRRQLRALGC